MRVSRILPYVGLALVVGAVFLQACSYHKEVNDLKSALGTEDEPLGVMATLVETGMTRAEARGVIQGYAWLKTIPPTQANPGGADIYHFEFGFPKMKLRLWDYGSIIITYDAQGRTVDAVADLN